MEVKKLIKNLGAVVADPSILRYYLPWIAARLRKRSAHLPVAGARIGGFPNFSSYLGAARHPLTSEETAFIRPRAKGATTIFDVGANFGVFAIYFARIEPEARIFAFEPNPRTAKALRENLARNNVENVTVIEAAISDFDGHLEFSDTADPATNKILQHEGGGLSVNARSLRSVCEEYAIDRIDFIKIDVEGAEVSVLEGGRSLFEEGRVASGVIEICPGNLEQFGRSISDLTGFFAELGVKLFLLGEKPGAPIDQSILLANAGFDCIGTEAT